MIYLVLKTERTDNMNENKRISIDKEAFELCIGKAIEESAIDIFGEKFFERLSIEGITKTAASRSWDMLTELSEEDKLLEEAPDAADHKLRQEIIDRVGRTIEQEVINRIQKDAQYAADSYSLELMYQTYGKLSMALMIGATSYQNTRKIHEYIMAQHINNGKWRRMCEKQCELPEVNSHE